MTNLAEKLIEEGRKLYSSPKIEMIPFSHVNEADKLVNDLEVYPHAFVLACLMDRQVKAEVAWILPYKFKQRCGSFHFEKLASLSFDEIFSLFVNPAPLHRYNDTMAKIFYSGIRHIENVYEKNASKIWNSGPSSAEVIYRFLEFEGAGPKIASMATNILAREFKVKFSDYYSIDISVDVHVRRVMKRLGLVSADASDAQIIYKSRAICPEFPGLIDLPCWEIGRNWCRPGITECNSCLMNALCPTSNQ